MKYLFIDTSATKMIVALVENETICYTFQEPSHAQLSTILLPKIEEAFATCNWKIREIDKIFVSTGPGSFTGIRVGVTVAKTIAWAQQTPIVPFSSLELIASGYEGNIVSFIDARNDNVYAGIYGPHLENIWEDRFIAMEDLLKEVSQFEPVIYVGFETLLDQAVNAPKMDILSVISKYKENEGMNPHHLNPNYLKATAAEQNLKKDTAHD